MSELRFETTVDLSMTELAALICDIWESDSDTPAVYAEQCRVFDVDLANSLIARTPDGAPVGLAVHCRRNHRAYLLDFGVVPSQRGKRYGHQMFAALLETLRNPGVQELSLLVAADNASATRIYEQAGLLASREMVSLRRRVPPVRSANVSEMRGPLERSLMTWFASELGGQPPTWERELPSLLGLSDLRAFQSEHCFLLARPSSYFHQIDICFLGLSAGVETEDLQMLLEAVSADYHAQRPLAMPNEPEGSRACLMLQELGFREVDRYVEMHFQFWQ